MFFQQSGIPTHQVHTIQPSNSFHKVETVDYNKCSSDNSRESVHDCVDASVDDEKNLVFL